MTSVIREQWHEQSLNYFIMTLGRHFLIDNNLKGEKETPWQNLKDFYFVLIVIQLMCGTHGMAKIASLSPQQLEPHSVSHFPWVDGRARVRKLLGLQGLF